MLHPHCIECMFYACNCTPNSSSHALLGGMCGVSRPWNLNAWVVLNGNVVLLCLFCHSFIVLRKVSKVTNVDMAAEPAALMCLSGVLRLSSHFTQAGCCMACLQHQTPCVECGIESALLHAPQTRKLLAVASIAAASTCMDSVT
jgi:hypothetical protein